MIKILIGIPGSGKSTWAKLFIKTNKDWVRINRDDFRFMLKDEPLLDREGEKIVTQLVNNAIKISAKAGKNIIIDQTNCNLSLLNELIYFCRKFSEVEFKLFDIDLNVAIERDLKRERSVGQEVIKKMYNNLDNVKKNFDFKPLKKQVNIPIIGISSKIQAVIFDIDGTLALMSKDRGPFEWKKVGLDCINTSVCDALIAHYKAGKYIILLSGRDGICRSETEKWLKDNYIPYHELYMRGINDMRKDVVIKQEIYKKHIEPKYSVVSIYDDRDQVVEGWRELGLTCFQVAEGNF